MIYTSARTGDPTGASGRSTLNITVGEMSFNILVVCIGNVCRSAQAERLLCFRLDVLLGDQSSAFDVTSAGVRAMVGNAMDASSAQELKRLGGTAAGFVSTQLTREHVQRADLVLTATKDLRSRVLQDVPGALRRSFTLPEFAALVLDAAADTPKNLVADAARRRSSAHVENYDVTDPIGRSAEVHRHVATVLDWCTQVIATSLANTVLSDS